MAEWEGFTEEDLRKFQSNSHSANISRPKIVKPVSKKKATIPSGSARPKQQPVSTFDCFVTFSILQ